MEPWKARPLGFAIVDEPPSSALAVHHVSVTDDGVSASGLWKLPLERHKADVANLLTHWVPIGTRDGIAATNKVLGKKVVSADLASLVSMCEASESQLQADWSAYQELEPKKRANLKPLAARTWPAVAEDEDAARLLRKLGKAPYPLHTPSDMQDIIAMSRLVMTIADTWFELESERLSRSYLAGAETERKLYPPEWLLTHSPYWP